ncbi:MAG: GFA family protein [Gammaproteobacteria bacterium]
MIGNTDKVKRTGGCACGQVRYGFYEPRVAQVACHCRACQYESGGGPSYVVTVQRDEFRVTKGRPKEFTTLSDAGNHVTRVFCGECGSPLYAYNDAHPEHCAVKVGSLDEPAKYKPRIHIWISEAQPWHKRGWFTARFSKNPPWGRSRKRKPDTDDEHLEEEVQP